MDIEENKLRAYIIGKKVTPDDLVRHFGEKVFVCVEGAESVEVGEWRYGRRITKC